MNSLKVHFQEMLIYLNPVALRLRFTQCLSVPSVTVIYKSERISLSVSLPPSGPPNRRRQGLQKSPSCLFEFRVWDKSSLLTSSRPPGMCKRSPLIFQHPAWPFCIRSLLPSPPWLLKSFYLHVSRPSEYLTSTADITWKCKQMSKVYKISQSWMKSLEWGCFSSINI